jgi:hypothetical protein
LKKGRAILQQIAKQNGNKRLLVVLYRFEYGLATNCRKLLMK